MQSNNTADWVPEKSQVGLTYGETMNPEININARINWLFLKGMKSDAQGHMDWRMGNGGEV